MNRFRFIWPPLVVVALTGALAYGVFWVTRTIWAALVDVNPQLAVGVVAAATTLVVSTATVMLGRYYERRKEIEAHFRSEKIKIYDEFLAELFKLFQGDTQSSDDMVKFLRQWQRKLVLWGGAAVLTAYFKWMNQLKRTPDAQTVFLMDEFFRALRADIGQSSRSIPRGAFANLILQHGDFFLAQAQINPTITLAELSELEKKVYGEG